MPAPLSIDLRRRIVAAYEAENRSYREIAERFSVGEATVNRYVNQFRRTGSVAPQPARGGPESVLRGEALDKVRILVVQKVDRTLPELARLLMQQAGISVSRQTMGRAVRRLNLSRKKSRLPQPNGTASASSLSDDNLPR